MRVRSSGKIASQSASKRPPLATAIEASSAALGNDPYWMLFEEHPRPMFVFDEETHQILAVNRAVVEDYGYSRDELLSMNMRDIRPPEDAATFTRVVSEPLGERRHFGRVWRHVRKDGSGLLVEVSAAAVVFAGRPARLCIAYDVTAREATSAALQRSEARKSGILDAVQDAVVVADMDGRISEFNLAAERIFGYSRAEVLGSEIAEVLVPPYMRSRHRRSLAHYVETGERNMIGRTAEMIGMRADGSEFPIEISLSAVHVDGQHVFTASIRDLTERKRSEALIAVGYGVARAVAESSGLNEMVPAVLEVIGEALGWDVGAMWCVDPATQVLRLLGVWHLPDADVAAFEAECQRRMFARGLSLPGRVWVRGGPVFVPDVYAEHGCPRFDVARQCGLRSAFAFPIPDGEETLGVVEFFGREMHEPEEAWLELFNAIGNRLGLYLRRHREEESHQATSHNLQALLHSSPLAVVLIDPDKHVSYWNPAAERMFGWTVKEMVGRPYASVVPAEKVEEFHKHLSTVLAGRQIIAKETWRLRKDGTRVHVSISGAPLHGPRGDVVGAVVMAADLSLRQPGGGG